jgi:pimeloyl-ACP methyl ester carboxylesterase
VIQRIDLGVCAAYEYEGDAERTAIALPGAMLGGMPALWFAFEPLLADGWRVILVWDEFLDRSQDPWEWCRARAEAAGDYAGHVHLVIAKSLTTRAATVAAERGWPAVWLTPFFDDETIAALGARSAPALFVGGTEDPMWDGAVARELGEVCELEGADHGLARSDQAHLVAQAVAEFSGRLRA